jgi:hypothetical protein
MSDEITLTLPRDPGFQPVAHLVLGGLAARVGLTIENLEDAQLALNSLLDRNGAPDGEVTMLMTVRDDDLQLRIGPLQPDLLDEIESDDENGGDEIDLRRVLESAVEDVHVDGAWVCLTKRIAGAG